MRGPTIVLLFHLALGEDVCVGHSVALARLSKHLLHIKVVTARHMLTTLDSIPPGL